MVREALIALEIAGGVGALAVGAYMLVSRGRRVGAAGSFPLLGWAVLVILGAVLLASFVLLLASVAQARIVSLEAGILFAGWAVAYLSTRGAGRMLPFVGLILGIAVVVLALLLPSPG